MTLLNKNPKTKKEGLVFFQKTGHLLVDATYKPINKLSDKIRNETIMADFENLITDLKSLGGIEKYDIILVKANICRLLEPKLKTDGFNIRNNGIVIPFPSTGQQPNFYKTMGRVYGGGLFNS